MKKRALLIVVILVFILIVMSYIYLNQTKNYDLEKRFGIHGNIIEYGTYDKSEDVAGFFKKFEGIFVRDILNKVMPSQNSPSNKIGQKVKTMCNEFIFVLQKF